MITSFNQRNPIIICFFLFSLSLGLHAVNLGTLPLMDRDEPRFSESSREMRERGDLLIPYFNGKERFDKPPLFYWCQIASYRLSGENDFAARFPSSLAAAITALLVFGFGSRLGGRKTGFWAAVIFTLSVQTLVLARAATTDMLLALFYTLSLWSAWELMTKKSLFWWILLYAGTALGFLTKGPVALLPYLSIFIFLRRANVKSEKLFFLPGILFSALLVALWAVPALLRTNGAYFQVGIGRHVLERSVAPLEHHGARNLSGYILTLPFYLVTFFVSFFPWSLRSFSITAGLKKHGQDTELNYLVCQVLCVFAVFTLLRTKLPHYTFPAFPALSILWARLWVKENLSTRRWTCAACFMVGASLLASLVLFPWASHYLPSRELVKECAAYLKPGMRLASAGYNEPSLVWYFRKYVRSGHEILSENDMPRYMHDKGPRICIAPTESMAKISGSFPAEWKSISVKGFNPAKGQPVSLTALIKPD